MNAYLVLTSLLFSLNSFGQLSPADVKKADELARESAQWFQYTTGAMTTDHLGQCGDYAVRFILNYNKYAGSNVARLVTTNNPIPSGTYRLGEKVDLGQTTLHLSPGTWGLSNLS